MCRYVQGDSLEGGSYASSFRILWESRKDYVQYIGAVCSEHMLEAYTYLFDNGHYSSLLWQLAYSKASTGYYDFIRYLPYVEYDTNVE